MFFLKSRSISFMTVDGATQCLDILLLLSEERIYLFLREVASGELILKAFVYLLEVSDLFFMKSLQIFPLLLLYRLQLRHKCLLVRLVH
ncbi:MAG TPA: hypothetical protein EYQ63_08285 [Fuerstia sp.]|nr:hypothetical protein [Fuerstiella sp.]